MPTSKPPSGRGHRIGYGFWTHQIQGGVSWYPWADKRMAVAGALTYEIYGEKEDFDLTPGQSLTLNWGVSQYLPLKKDQSLLLEIGPAGYGSWQVTDDSGSDAATSSVKDEVHAAGGQIGITHVPWNAALNFHYFYEFAAEDRFSGTVRRAELCHQILISKLTHETRGRRFDDPHPARIAGQGQGIQLAARA